MESKILGEPERMGLMVALGEAERHITDDKSTDRHRRARRAVNDCQGIFGSGPKASRNVGEALNRVRDALRLLRLNGNESVESQELHRGYGSANLLAAARSLEAVQALLESFPKAPGAEDSARSTGEAQNISHKDYVVRPSVSNSTFTDG